MGEARPGGQRCVWQHCAALHPGVAHWQLRLSSQVAVSTYLHGSHHDCSGCVGQSATVCASQATLLPHILQRVQCVPVLGGGAIISLHAAEVAGVRPGQAAVQARSEHVDQPGIQSRDITYRTFTKSNGVVKALPSAPVTAPAANLMYSGVLCLSVAPIACLVGSYKPNLKPE